jgi:hypothetical protein
MTATWKGPFRIVRKLSDTIYQLNVGAHRGLFTSLISDKRSLTLMTCSITDFSTSSSPVIANFNISVGPLNHINLLKRYNRNRVMNIHDFKINYRSGASSKNADGMSRV